MEWSRGQRAPIKNTNECVSDIELLTLVHVYTTRRNGSRKSIKNLITLHVNSFGAPATELINGFFVKFRSCKNVRSVGLWNFSHRGRNRSPVDHSIPAMVGRAPARVPDLCFSNRCLITLRMRVIDEQFSVKYWNENTTGYCRLIRCNGQIKRSRNKSWNIEGEWKRDPLLWHTDRIQSVLTCTVFTYHSDNFVAMIFDISKYDRGAIWNC